MKKNFNIFISLIILFSFAFYSCASDSKDTEAEMEPPLVENSDLNENAENNISKNVDSEQLDSIAFEEPLEIEESTEVFNFPEELEEPDVFEEEIPEINEEFDNTITSEDNNDSEEPEELITLDELDVLDELDEIIDISSELDSTETEQSNTESENIENTDDNISEETENIDNFDLNSDIEENVQNNPFEVPVESETEVFTNESDILFETDTDSIDISENDEIEEESAVTEEIIPSRKVTLKRGEYLDVIYPGNGWIYVGLIDGSKDVTYNGRKLGTENTTFTLIAKVPGTKIVHFYKTDNLTGEYIDDYLEIEILNERTTSKVRQIAPSYADLVPVDTKNNTIEINSFKKNTNELDFTETAEDTDIIDLTESSNNSDDDIIFLESTEEKNSENKTKIEDTIFEDSNLIDEQNINSETIKSNLENSILNSEYNNSPVSNIDPETILKDAKNAFNEKNYENALKMIEDYINLSPRKLDEAYYLKGQIYETQSGIQNINNAVEEYEKIIKLYPSSKYWEKANKRIIYLKRFYLEVR